MQEEANVSARKLLSEVTRENHQMIVMNPDHGANFIELDYLRTEKGGTK